MAASMTEADNREFSFSRDEFDRIRELVKQHTGIVLAEGKQDMVYSRLSRRLRVLSHGGFSEYLKHLERDDDGELLHLVNAITTNLTSFFREGHHFEHLKNELLPALMMKNQASRRIRIWSAGCSTGEEPYSLAMTIREVIPERSDWDVKILATDLDSNVLDTGRRGVYPLSRVDGVPEQCKRRWMLKGRGDAADKVKMRSELQSMIQFKRLNLIEPWPIKGPLDLIFCRNVVIYFDKDTQRDLFHRFAEVLRPDGRLFIGHSENIFNVSDRFKLLGHTIYKRIR